MKMTVRIYMLVVALLMALPQCVMSQSQSDEEKARIAEQRRIVEQVFAIPGIGQLAVSSTVKADIPMVMGLVLVTAVIVVLVNLLIDLAQAALNPKVRM